MSIFINKAEITAEEIGQEMQYHPAPTQEEAWHEAALRAAALPGRRRLAAAREAARRATPSSATAPEHIAAACVAEVFSELVQRPPNRDWHPGIGWRHPRS